MTLVLARRLVGVFWSSGVCSAEAASLVIELVSGCGSETLEVSLCLQVPADSLSGSCKVDPEVRQAGRETLGVGVNAAGLSEA